MVRRRGSHVNIIILRYMLRLARPVSRQRGSLVISDYMWYTVLDATDSDTLDCQLID